MPTKPALWTQVYPHQRLSKPKARKRLPKVSKKRARENRIYGKWREEFLREFPFCQRCLKKGFAKKATEVHHHAGRRKNYLNKRTWRSSCHDCNMFAKEHPKEAIAENWRAPVGVYLT